MAQIKYNLGNVGQTTGNYSYDEIEIGTWVNGKPIYRKVYNIDVSAITTGSLNVIESNSVVDMLVNSQSIIEYQLNGYTYMYYVNGVIADTNSRLNSYKRDSDIVFYIGSGFSNIQKLLFVVEYTKTTDSAI